MRSRRRRPGAGALAATLFGLLGLTSCPESDPCQEDASDPSCPNHCQAYPADPACAPPGPTSPTKGQAVADVDHPLAAALDPQGKVLYLAAFDERGHAQLYQLPAQGGERSLVATGDALSYPVGLAVKPDGSAILVADLGDPGGLGDETGAVYSVTLSGGAVSLTMGEVQRPGGVAVASDGDIYVTGTAREDGLPGVWRFPAVGGPPTLLHKGAPLDSPSGIALTSDGSIYVTDLTALGPREGAVLKVVPGGATVVSKAPLSLTFPAGIAPAGLGHGEVLVTALRPADRLGAVFLMATTGELTELMTGATANEPGTLHRAAKENAWVLVDALSLPPSPEPDKAPGRLFQLTP